VKCVAPLGTRAVIPVEANETTDLYSRWTMYFYVPKGTKVVAGDADGLGELLNSIANRFSRSTTGRMTSMFLFPQDKRVAFGNSQIRSSIAFF
jgi:hypothetical protein